MVQFMQNKGYAFEQEFVEVVLNWRRASDERGLSQLERCHFNYNMLNFILDELMPWHATIYDFSTLEVNRYGHCTHTHTHKHTHTHTRTHLFRKLDGVRGLSRETVIALTTTISSREWIRILYLMEGIHPEHPRASTTDDVECFFSIIRGLIGDHFTAKAVMLEWRKICLEYSKRMDKTLPYYYFTASHERFYETERESFDTYVKPRSNPRLQRIRQLEQPGNLAPGRTTMIKPAKSIRRQFHALPVEVPPPVGAQIHELVAIEHSYN